MMGKSAFFSEGTAGQMKSAPSFAKDDDSTLPKEPNGSKIRLGPKPIWGMSVDLFDGFLKDKGYLAMGGQIIDATIVSAPKQHNSGEENETIKEGQVDRRHKFVRRYVVSDASVTERISMRRDAVRLNSKATNPSVPA